MRASTIITMSLIGTTIQQSFAECLIGDTMYTEGQSNGFIGLECINSTSFVADTSTCGPNGQLIDEEMVMTCDESVPYCVQCGSRGLGAALCLSTPDLDDRDCGDGEEPEGVTVTTRPNPNSVATDSVCNEGAACSEEGSTCNYGKAETCCGETFYTFECVCYNSEYMCMFTDRCADRVCDTETSSTVDGAGVVEKANPSPVEITATVATVAVTVTSFMVDTCEVGGTCSEEGSTCNNGQTETCCGETFNSFECECSNGRFMCRYTDRCMRPACETTTLPTVVRASTVQSASIEGGGSSTLAVEPDSSEGGDPSITTVEPNVSMNQTSAVEPDGMVQASTSAPTPANTVDSLLLGAGTDANDCLSSAGYTYCIELAKCIQGFETPCPVDGTDFVGPVLVFCSNGRCSLTEGCEINMGTWTAGGLYVSGLDGKYLIPDGCTATCDDECVVDGEFDGDDDVDADGPLFQTKGDGSSAYGVCALRIGAVSMLSIGASMMLA